MTSFDNPFLTILLNGIRAEAERTEGVTLSVEDAQLDVAKQLNQVQNFVANGVDAIIVNAVDGDSTAAITATATVRPTSAVPWLVSKARTNINTAKTMPSASPVAISLRRICGT